MKELIRWADGATLVLPESDREWDSLVSPCRKAGGWETKLARRWQNARITPLLLSEELGRPIGSISIGSAVDGGAMVHTETPSPDINASTRRKHKSVRRKAAWLITALRAAGIGVDTLYFFTATSDQDRTALFQASTREDGSFCPELEACLLLGILPPELARQQPNNG